MTKIELELIPYPDMYIFFEKGTRGGISFIFLIDTAKPTINIWNLMTQNKNQKHIIYLDANNLYDYAMFQQVDSNG